MANEVLKNDTAVSLDWPDVSGANRYHLQVSVFPDFSVLLVDHNFLLASAESFSDGGTNNRKRFWRWRSSADAGTTWSEWSGVASYWLYDGLAGDLSLSSGVWALIDPDDTTDKYIMPSAPVAAVQRVNLTRLETRNRKGDLLTEYVTVKSRIDLDFQEERFIGAEQMSALCRFNEEKKVFFLAGSVYDGRGYVPNVWKVQYSEDPRFTILASGRSDYFLGLASFVEA